MSHFKSLTAWRKARRLVKSVYEFTGRFPESERYVLRPQMRRAVHSVHSNIAEGNGRLTNGEWQHFLGQSRGSLLELESHIVAAFDLGYCSLEESRDLTEKVKRVVQLVNGLLRSSMKGFKSKKYKLEPPANG